MTSVAITRVLAEMRALAAQASNQSAESASARQVDFAALLTNSINRVDDLQKNAAAIASAYEAGAKGVDMAQVTIEAQKAGVALSAMTEVRNKLVQAYQDIMNMPL